MQGHTVGLRALFFLLFLAPGVVSAELWVWDSILLDGSQQVPPVETPATGTATAQLDTTTSVITIEGEFQGLLGLSNDAHLHWPAFRGQGGAGTLFDLVYDVGVHAGRFHGTSGVLSEEIVADILAGRTFVNVHSTIASLGEIRGQLENAVRVPEPGGAALLVLSNLALACSMGARRLRGQSLGQ